MSKLIGDIFGVILAIMVAVWFLGATTLQSEKTAFVQEATELTQRLKEEGGVYDELDPTNSVTAYLKKINGTKLDTEQTYLKLTETNHDDKDADGSVSYGDVLTYTFERYGSGSWGMNKSDAQKVAQGLSADKPNAAHFVKTVEILVDRR